MIPTRPVRRFTEFPGLRGAYKVAAQDFEVEEIPAYEPSGEGEHLWLWLEKQGIGTPDAVRRLSKAFGIRDREIGYAGLKDAHAVTRQWVSMPAKSGEGAESWSDENVRVLRAVRHRNKLKIGHLRGNRFRIVLRGSDVGEADQARALLDRLTACGVPNWFGEQRFGNFGGNLKKGLRILRGNPQRAGRSMPRRLLGLVVSAVQSEIFNRVLKERIEDYEKLRDGDVAWLHRNGACFVVADASAERERLDAMEVSASGPLHGPAMLQPEGESLVSEQSALGAFDLDEDAFGAAPRGVAQGARRPLRVPLWEPQVETVDDCLVLTFGLPRGAYATAVLREVLAEAPWFEEEAAEERPEERPEGDRSQGDRPQSDDARSDDAQSDDA